MLQRYYKFQSQTVSDIWIRLPKHKWPISLSSMEDPVVPLGRNLYGHLLTTIMGKAIWKVLLEHGWETILNWECLFVNRARGLFLSVYVDDIKLAGKTENIEPTWKILMKDVDLGEPTSFLDSLYLGCTQRECQFRKDSVTNYSLNLYASWNAYGGNFLPIIHEDHVAGKGHHYNLVHTFIPMPQAMKIPLAKAAVDKEWEKLEKIPAWDLTKVRSKSEVIDEARTKGAKVHFVSRVCACVNFCRTDFCLSCYVCALVHGMGHILS